MSAASGTAPLIGLAIRDTAERETTRAHKRCNGRRKLGSHVSHCPRNRHRHGRHRPRPLRHRHRQRPDRGRQRLGRAAGCDPRGHRQQRDSGRAVCGATCAAALLRRYAEVSVIELPDGEQFKDWATLNLIFDRLLPTAATAARCCSRWAAASSATSPASPRPCYMRGVAFVQVPTTLLAQVDSSVGGKTAINHPLGKNMIGAFHQPLRVVCDLDTLNSCRRANCAPAWPRSSSTGRSPTRRSWTGSKPTSTRCWHATPRRWRTPCAAAARSRRRWSGQDERESGLRAILNFGHTFGHAIEAGLGYGQWLHGEAVACGMVLASELSARTGAGRRRLRRAHAAR